MNKKHVKNKKFSKILNNKVVIAIAFLLFVVVCIIALSCIGKSLPSLIPFGQKIEGPISFSGSSDTNNDSENSKIYAAIDQQGHRLCLLDNNMNIYNQINLDLDNNILNYGESVYIIDSEIYVSGYIIDKNSSKFSETRLVKFSQNGDYLDTIYKFSATSNSYRAISDLTITNGTIYLILNQDSTIYYEAVYQNNEEWTSDLIFSCDLDGSLKKAMYNKYEKLYLLIDELDNAYYIYNNKLYRYDFMKVLSELPSLEYYSLKYINTSNAYSRVYIVNNITNQSKPLRVQTGVCFLDWNTNLIYYSDTQTDSIIIYDLINGGEKTYNFLNYEFNYGLNIIIKWACIILSLLVAISFIIIWFIKYKKENNNQFWKIIVGLSLFVAILFSATFVCFKFYNESQDDLYNKVSAISQSISDNYVWDGDELNYRCLNKTVVGEEVAQNNKDNLYKFSQNFKNLSSNFQNAQQSLSYNFYGIDYRNGMVEYIKGLGLENSLEYSNHGFTNDELIRIRDGKTAGGIFQGKYDDMVYSASAIYNDKHELVCAIELQSSLSYLYLDYFNSFKDILIALILLVIVIYLCFTVWENFKENINNYQIAKAKKFLHPEINLVIPIEFFRNFTISLDSVMCVIITKDMLTIIGQQDNGILLGIPMFSSALGAFICILIFPKLKNSLSIKTIYMIGSFAMIITYGLIAVSVFINNYWYFSVIKILSGIALGTLYVASSTLPMCVNDKKLRFNVIRGMSLNNISSSILAVYLAGYAVEIFGSYFIYLLGSIVGVVTVIICYFGIPKNQYFSKDRTKQQRKNKLPEIIRFFISPAIIAIILVCFAETTVGAYKTYLFPLYTSDMSISSSEISNYFTICSALAYLISKWIDRFKNSIDHWTNTIILLCLLGTVYIVFVVNTTLLWAIATFLLSSTISKYLSTEWKVLWVRKSNVMRLDPSDIQPVFTAIEYSAITLRPVLVGSLLVFGSVGACISLGISIFIVAIVFYIFTYKSPLRKNKLTNPK